MIELKEYLATIAIFSGIIIALVIHIFREKSFKSQALTAKSTILSLQKENTEFKDKMTASEKDIFNLKDKNNEQQEQITKQLTHLAIFSKFTFDRRMGFIKSKTDGKSYCTACLLEFKEIQLIETRTPIHCPSCGADYPPK